jgi:hypothetical protein
LREAFLFVFETAGLTQNILDFIQSFEEAAQTVHSDLAEIAHIEQALIETNQSIQALLNYSKRHQAVNCFFVELLNVYSQTFCFTRFFSRLNKRNWNPCGLSGIKHCFLFHISQASKFRREES